jgi:hypothetical protein
VLDFEKIGAAQLLPILNFLHPPYHCGVHSLGLMFKSRAATFSSACNSQMNNNSMLRSVNKPAAHTCARLKFHDNQFLKDLHHEPIVFLFARAGPSEPLTH